MVSANLFTEAVKIAKAYGLDYRPIVEGLTSRCIYLSRAKPSEKDVAWLVIKLPIIQFLNLKRTFLPQFFLRIEYLFKNT